MVPTLYGERMSGEIASVEFRLQPSQTITSAEPKAPIEITGGTLVHVGPPTPALDPRAYKAKGYKLIWVMTRDEMKASMPLADEITFAWESDEQLRSALHREISKWIGAQIVPEGEKQERVAGI